MPLLEKTCLGLFRGFLSFLRLNSPQITSENDTVIFNGVPLSNLIYIMTLLNTYALNMLKIEIKLQVASQMATLTVASRQKPVIQEQNRRKTIKTLPHKV